MFTIDKNIDIFYEKNLNNVNKLCKNINFLHLSDKKTK